MVLKNLGPTAMRFPVAASENLAREHGLELVLAADHLAPGEQGSEEDAERHQDVGKEDPSEDGRLREGVHRLHDATACEERPEQAQTVGEPDQQQIPGLQHVPLFLDHHRVQVRRAGEPGHERRVLHRVPGPVAAPAEHLVGPAAAEHDADREEEPGE
jgi:hypothetical protein